MKTLRGRKTKWAFTLIELMVVIAIIGLLAGMLLPVIKLVQEKARQAHCMNNLHQFGRAIAIYEMENEERYPSNLVALAHDGYIDNPELFKCRSDRWRSVPETVTNITESTADDYCSYNLVTRDKSGARLGPGLPSRTMIACDKDGEHGSISDSGFGGNHGGDGGNVLYADSSVKWVRTKQWEPKRRGSADLSSVVGH